jgi:phosphoribosylformylglycinamidine cyclo-ligase
MNEISLSRGESAYVWEEKDCHKAIVIEGLGTKNLIADEVSKFTGKSHYDSIAQDTVAMIVNDLIVVGADPQVINAYFAVGSSDWFLNKNRARDLVYGWAKAVNMSGAVWGGGETPTLKGIIKSNTIDLSGSAVGIIKPKSRLTLGDKLVPGNAIFAIESSGIHANGLTLARKIASKLPRGYKTLLSNGKSYGESLLSPTHIYAGLVRDLFDAGIDIHYMANITGHGWRKIMRANSKFSYIIETVPEISPLFEFIQKKSGIDDYEMYGNFNMGIGFVIFMPEKDVETAKKITRKKYNWNSWKIGVVEKGSKEVIIKQKNILFKSESLKVR